MEQKFCTSLTNRKLPSAQIFEIAINTPFHTGGLHKRLGFIKNIAKKLWQQTAKFFLKFGKIIHYTDYFIFYILYHKNKYVIESYKAVKRYIFKKECWQQHAVEKGYNQWIEINA